MDWNEIASGLALLVPALSAAGITGVTLSRIFSPHRTRTRELRRMAKDLGELEFASQSKKALDHALAADIRAREVYGWNHQEAQKIGESRRAMAAAGVFGILPVVTLEVESVYTELGDAAPSTAAAMGGIAVLSWALAAGQLKSASSTRRKRIANHQETPPAVTTSPEAPALSAPDSPAAPA